MPNAPSRDPSQKASKRAKALPQLPSKPRPGLAVDTSFSRHLGTTPKQVFPYESKKQELSFVGLNDVRTLSNEVAYSDPPKKSGTLKTVLENHRATSTRATASGGEVRNEFTLQAPPSHKRIKGLKPSGLPLGNDISPSDQAIPIGIELPSTDVSSHTTSASPPAPCSQPQPQRLRNAQDLPTPTIVITPAKEDFDCVFTESSCEARIGKHRRPSSSIYSSNTNGTSRIAIDGERTPPVPPLPLFAAQGDALLHYAQPDPAATAFEENDTLAYPSTSRSANALSMQTVFEENGASSSHDARTDDNRRRSSYGQIPTPRRSNGWWNVIMSPFMSSAKLTGGLFRSPPLVDDSDTEDKEPILSGASNMGVSEYSGVVFRNRSLHDDELQSAPAGNCNQAIFHSKASLSKPQRSETAPGALDMGNVDDFNIYRIPSQGAAVSYYDAERNFPNMTSPGSHGLERGANDLDGWSPSQSVPRESRAISDDEFYQVPSEGTAAPYYDPNRRFPSMAPLGNEYGSRDMAGWDPRDSVAQNDSDSGNGNPRPAARSISHDSGSGQYDSNEARKIYEGTSCGDDDYLSNRSGPITIRTGKFDDFSGTHPATQRPFSQTPSSDELGDHTPSAPSSPRNEPESYFSPMTATPIIQDAHMATYLGPKSSHGEQREVDLVFTRSQTHLPPLSSARPPTPTAVSRQGASYPPLEGTMAGAGTPYCRGPQYSGNNCSGLGISDAGSESGLFPPPGQLSEKPSMSSFGAEAENRHTAEKESTNRPWWRRFGLFLAGVVGLFLTLLIVLLVMFVPLDQDDMPVQAQWLNLTKFPPLPTGVTTVINPKNSKQVSGCVSQEQLWNCAVPANEGESSTPSTNPNFRFQIRFRNGTLPSNETALDLSTGRRNLGQASRAGKLARRSLSTDVLYSPSPAPPSEEDQIFLGRTTDGNKTPYNGEETPFYISLLNASALPPTHQKRDFHYPYPSSESDDSNSVASNNKTPPPHNRPAQLYPFASAQPLRLFNRGQDSEHYAFYTYFARTLSFCTWTQTRLRIQIWTHKTQVTSLDLSSSANEMTAPGSFPYPVTVTLDRHGGGEEEEKGVYCYYGTEDEHEMEESRGFGGELVNEKRDTGIDGGTGGCACQWRNW